MEGAEFEARQQGQEISQNEQSSEFIIPKYSARKEFCNICQAALYKYTCPRCKVKTCGISCLNKHKKNNQCSGIADPYSSLDCKQISEKDVEKDYLYVKQMLSNADKIKKTLSGIDSFTQEPKRFKIMRINAKKNYNITLLNAPTIIERHRQNISFYFVKTRTFYWVVQILYLRYQKEKQMHSRYLTNPTADSSKIIDILPVDYLCKSLLEQGINTQKKEQFKIYFQRKRKNIKEVIYFDHNSLLKDGLINQSLYEFPTIIAVHQTIQERYVNLHKKQSEKISIC